MDTNKNNLLKKEKNHFIQKKILCSVCIATYQRPNILIMLLGSLKQQELPNHVQLEIIIVDNDPFKSAKPIVSKFKNTCNIRYYTQFIKNISLTRNLCVEHARGEYILFIDDDEVASPQWVKCLLNTIEKTGADGVFGVVKPLFEESIPRWIKRRDLYFYGPIRDTGTKAETMYTNNCIVKASLLKKMRQPFDPSYGLTGGEDIHLFGRLALYGSRYIHCREALVTEIVPKSRTTVRYFFKRAFSGGNRNTRRYIEEYGTISVRLFMLFKSILFGVISLLLLVVLFPSKILRIKWTIKLASNMGRFFAVFGWNYKMYK